MNGLTIDLMGNQTFTEAQLNKRATALIWQHTPIQDEQKLSSVLHGSAMGTFTPSAEHQVEIEAYQSRRLAVLTALAQAKSNNALLIGALTYEAAENRLKRYRLAEGRVAEPVYETQTQINPDTLEEEEIQVQIGEIPAVEPLALTVDQVQEDGSVIQIPNPLVVNDDRERSDAQTVIDTASTGVTDLVADRVTYFSQ